MHSPQIALWALLGAFGTSLAATAEPVSASTATMGAAPSPRAPWVPEAGRGQASLQYAAFLSGTTYDDDGVGLVGGPVALQSQQLGIDVVVGLGPRLAFSGMLPLVFATATHRAADRDPEVFAVSGVGDATAGLAFALLPEGPLHLTLRGDVKVPLYAGLPSVQGRQPLATDPRQPGLLPALGDGQVDVTVNAVVGARFPFGGFFTWENGYRFRSGGVTDGVSGAGTFAVDVFDGALQPRWNHAFLFSFDPATDVDGVPTEIVGRSLVTTGPSCVVNLAALSPGLALEVGAALSFRGRNAAGGTRFQLGVSHAF